MGPSSNILTTFFKNFKLYIQIDYHISVRKNITDTNMVWNKRKINATEVKENKTIENKWKRKINFYLIKSNKNRKFYKYIF